jgi:hypothetical protein
MLNNNYNRRWNKNKDVRKNWIYRSSWKVHKGENNYYLKILELLNWLGLLSLG